jgi:hypothetical protein
MSTASAASAIPSPLPVQAALAGSPVASAVDWVSAIKPFTPDSLANGFATLVGALVGAMLAYFLQRRFQKNQERTASLMAAHKMMFALLQQINTIVLIQRDYIYEHLANPARFLSIQPTAPYDKVKNTLEIEDLSFLIDSREGRAILYDLYLAQENYIEALNQWNIRSRLHLEKVQPALAASNIQNGATVSMSDIEAVLGKLNLGILVNSTNNCIESLSRAFEKLAASKQVARAYVVARFKTNDFTDFDFPDTYGLKVPTNSAPPAKT